LKDFILKFWSMFVERFGAPVLISFVKAKNMKAARDALKSILTNSSFSMEQEDKVEMLEPKKEGAVFETMIKYCDNEITKGLLVPTLLLGSESEGAKSLGDIHFQLFEYRVRFIQRKLQNITRAFIKKEIDLNFDDVKHYPVFTFNPFSMNNRVKMAQTFDLLIKNALVHPNEPWVRNALQLPEAEARFIPKLDEAWKAKMTAGSGSVIGGMPSPSADITRTGAQTNQRQPASVGESTEFAISHEELKKQFINEEDKFRSTLVPAVNDKILELVKLVERKIKADGNIEFASTPSWLKQLKFEFGFSPLFAELYDEVLVDIVAGDNSRLASLGMKSAFDVQTRTGAFRWIDQKMGGIRSGLLDYGSAAANELELRILEDTKEIVQAGLDEGLRGRDVIKRLQDTLLGSRYTPAQLETVVRTNTTAIVNQGKKAFGRANSDFVKGFRFVAILDDRTTDICEQRDGKEFALNDPALDANTPPLHFSCRSVLDYITEGKPSYDPEGIDTDVPEGFGDGIYALGKNN
jgi:SPP1 gp7 family putative phage head morphogenesis protein